MREETRVVIMTPFQQRLLVRGLNEFRGILLRDGQPTEDVDALLLKVIDAPRGKGRCRAGREERG